MTLLNLKDIFESSDIFEGRYDLSPEEISLPPDLGEIREGVSVFLRITKDKDGYRVFMSISGSVELECSRCLAVFNKDISQEMEKHLEGYPSEDHLSLSEEDLEVSFLEDSDTIDLASLVREEIILGIPMKPLCKPDCSGVSDKSFIFEEEKRAPKDPRFAILKNLLTE